MTQEAAPQPALEELKPCPFCGRSKAKYNYDDTAYSNGCAWVVICQCGACGENAATQTEAIAFWNTRFSAAQPQPPETGGLVARLRRYEDLGPLSSLSIHPETPGYTTGNVLADSRDAIDAIERLERERDEALDQARRWKHGCDAWEIVATDAKEELATIRAETVAECAKELQSIADRQLSVLRRNAINDAVWQIRALSPGAAPLTKGAK